jgi:hypothetical protein
MPLEHWSTQLHPASFHQRLADIATDIARCTAFDRDPIGSKILKDRLFGVTDFANERVLPASLPESFRLM